MLTVNLIRKKPVLCETKSKTGIFTNVARFFLRQNSTKFDMKKIKKLTTKSENNNKNKILKIFITKILTYFG